MEEWEENETDPDAQSLDDMRLQMKEDELPAAMDVPNYPFRTAANPRKMDEVYLAAAEAVRKMPELRLVDMHFDIHGGTELGKGEHYFRFVQGEDFWIKKSNADVKVVCEVTPDFEVAPEALQAWRDVAVA